MSRVATNTISLAFAKEQTLGVLPTTPLWKLLEPNTIGTFGPNITTVTRNPISKDRQRKKGTISDLDSSVEFDADLTLEHIMDFFAAFLFAKPNDPGAWGSQETNTITAVATTGYTVSAGGALALGTLVYARGFTSTTNNGLKHVTTGSDATHILTVETLVLDAAPTDEARVDVCGVEGASGDLTVTSGGDLASTVLDFTTLGLTVGQVIWVGGDAAADSFATVADRGWARIVTIAAHLLTLDKQSAVWTADAGTSKTVHVYFGRFLRNVTVDDADFDEASYCFEAAFPDLGGIGTDQYEYSKGNYCNQLTINLPLTDKATCTFSFVGTDTVAPSAVRAAEASDPLTPVQTTAFNTSADIARLRITKVDETGLTTYFKSLNLTLNNNVTPEKVLANLGAAFINLGNFDVGITAQMLFTDGAVLAAIRANTTVTLDFTLRNDNGAIYMDIPAMTLGGGGKEYPENETVLLNTTATAFEDPTLGTSIGISLLPYAPAA